MSKTPIISINEWSNNQFVNDLIDKNKGKYKQIFIEGTQNQKLTRRILLRDQQTLEEKEN